MSNVSMELTPSLEKNMLNSYFNGHNSKSSILKSSRKLETIKNTMAELKRTKVSSGKSKDLLASVSRVKEELNEMQRKLNKISSKKDLEKVVRRPLTRKKSQKRMNSKKRRQSLNRSYSVKDELSTRTNKLEECYIASKARREELLSELLKERRIGNELRKVLDKYSKKLMEDPTKELEKIKKEYELLERSFMKSEKLRVKQKAKIEKLQKTLDSLKP